MLHENDASLSGTTREFWKKKKKKNIGVSINDLCCLMMNNSLFHIFHKLLFGTVLRTVSKDVSSLVPMVSVCLRLKPHC